jgi:hypothetical protein
LGTFDVAYFVFDMSSTKIRTKNLGCVLLGSTDSNGRKTPLHALARGNFFVSNWLGAINEYPLYFNKSPSLKGVRLES